jgi:hypothetical protein
MEPIVFRWIRNLRGLAYAERALAAMPNHYAHRTIQEFTLTDEQTKLDFEELCAAFPRPNPT